MSNTNGDTPNEVIYDPENRVILTPPHPERDMTQMWKDLEDVRIRLWFCEDRDHSGVSWKAISDTQSVPKCNDCGREGPPQ